MPTLPIPSLQPVTQLLQGLGPRAADPGPRDRRCAERIKEAARQLGRLTDTQLRSRAHDLRNAFTDTNRPIDGDGQVRAFALVSEAARRTLSIEYYDVQHLAGLALARNAIAEMQTGEGKTFVAALPAFFLAMAGDGVHVMTVNSYLAERDCRLLRPLYEMLGMSVGQLSAAAPPDDKRAAYACDITYGPGYEFGFDYLRDQAALLVRGKRRLGDTCLQRLRGNNPVPQLGVQRGQAFAIVDEIDSVLIDEAMSPLVLSQSANQPARYPGVYQHARQVAAELVTECDYLLEPASRIIRLTSGGAAKVQASMEHSPLLGLKRPWPMYIEQALRARLLLHKDVDYIVKGDKILLVDESTGRIFADRTLRQGLHQAIEAKEDVLITAEQEPLARISRQRCFRLYRGLCGMTGTASGNEREFWNFYCLPVVRIPRHRPCRRQLLPARFFADQSAKWNAIGESVRQRHAAGQPVLVGTRSIEHSAALAERLRTAGLDFQLLNGTQDMAEAEIIARAGQAGAVTVATNMAGRGTDIKLGAGVDEVGGLHVIVSEPHESARVDRQLVGRSARQADAGSSQTFVAADDSLILLHAPSLGARIRRSANATGEIARDFSGDVRRAQQLAERRAYARRRQVKAQDDWLEDVLSQLARES
ncbi:MAG: preprotein translocase subunit SecA [Pirellulales bacterium]